MATLSIGEDKVSIPMISVEAALSDPYGPLGCVYDGTLLLKSGQHVKAREKYEQALRSDPSCKQAHAGLYYAWKALGNKHKAATHLGKALQLPAIVPLPYSGGASPTSVLLLWSINSGNVLFQRFLEGSTFKTHLVILEFYERSTTLPPHQLIVNAIGDADVHGDALAAAETVISVSSAPVINSPATVYATGRCDNAQRLSSISGVVTPKAITLSREILESSDIATRLADYGFHFPLLLRAPGFHMGKHFVRVGDAGELTDAVAKLPGKDLIVLEYLDARGADGFARKYRAMMVDGHLYPVHLAISSDWKIHYFSAEMANHPEHRAEDAAFLSDMEAVLGCKAMAALKQIQSTLGLDYGGVDFGLNKDGEVLLFEANATMGVAPPDPNPIWDYRREAIDRIYAAVRQMMTSRALGSHTN
jgi:glutathione synthase/RimK-type ligase-like ATP-grasp enzyme